MSSISRRRFLESSGAAAVSAAALPSPALRAGFFAGGSDLLKVGLVGCGGRGTGAAVQALRADPNTRLWAVGDALADRLESSLASLTREDIGTRVDVPKERRFVGFDAYRQVMDSGIDVVVLATSPHFRPLHLKYAVDRGLHSFVEKPVAVDAPGVRAINKTCELARAKKLSVVSGLCYRYHDGRRAILNEIHEGRIGDIVALDVRYLTGGLWHHARQPDWSDMEWQMRNWLYFTWLSGDHIAEQHIHSLDVMAWAMKGRYPVKCISVGGRQARTGPEFGDVYDHFVTTYEFEDGTRGFSQCRQQVGCKVDVSDWVYGTKGTAEIFKHRIHGESPWRFEGKARDMYQNEHDALFAAIRAGKPIDDGEYMCKSTLMAIMGRMAAYTGQEITWDQAWNSAEDLTPKEYDWGPLPTPAVAVPGITRFV
jgi:predicted dehydrogenase